MYKYALYLQLNNGQEGYYHGECEDGTPKIYRDGAYGFPSVNAAKASLLGSCAIVIKGIYYE